jgi:hypothetical protein
MKEYVVKIFGWMTIIEAKDKREALSIAKARASGASLLSTDVNIPHISPSSIEQARLVRAKADSAWERGDKELSESLHEEARRLEKRGREELDWYRSMGGAL